MSRMRVLLVDDHTLVREGMRSLLSKSPVIGEIYEASNGHEALMRMRETGAEVVLMDFEMPNFDGIYATREICKEFPGTPVLLVSAHRTRSHILEGIKAGARGYLSKDAPIREVLEAIEALHGGASWFKGSIAELIAPSILDHFGNNRPGAKSLKNGQITSREREVVKLFAEGMTARGIAEALSISKRTVDVHKANIFKKLEITNVAELVRYAVKQGIVRF